MPGDAQDGTWDPLPSLMNVLGDNPPPKPAPKNDQPAGPIIPPPPSSRQQVQPAAQPAAEPAEKPAMEPIASFIPDGLIPGAAAKKEEPPNELPDVKPEDPEDFPAEVERGGQKARSAWTGIKKENKELAQKVKEYEQKMKDLEARASQADGAKPPEAQVLVDLQKKVAEYEDRVGKLDITQSRDFQTRFDLPIERSLKRGEALLQRAGVSPEDSQKLMQQMLKADAHQVQELIADQPIPLQGALFNLTTEIGQMFVDREEAIKNWKQTKAAMTETSVREQEITLAQNIEQDTSEAVQQAIKEGNFMYAQGPNMPKEWNEGVANRVNAVKGILRMAKPAELVKWVAEGVVAKDLRAMLAQEHARANQLAQELSTRANMRPRLGGNPPPSNATPSDAGVKPMDPRDLAAKLFS